MEGVAGLAWPKALGNSPPGENALNCLQLLRRRLAKLPQQPGPAGNTVGVEVVRGLYGVVEEKRATKGIIATTSYFSADAKRDHSKLEYRLGLADYDRLCAMLNEWRARKN